MINQSLEKSSTANFVDNWISLKHKFYAKNRLDPFIRFDTTPACDRHGHYFSIESVKYNVTTLKIKDCSPHMNWIELVEGFAIFTVRCYASVVLAMDLCLSVCPSQVGVLLKLLNVWSHKQHHTVIQGLYFSDSAKFDRGHSSYGGRQMQVGCVK